MSTEKISESLAQLATLFVFCVACLLVAWECWPRVGQWHKRHLAGQLASQIEQAPEEEAELLVHELAGLGTAAVDELVAGTLSQRTLVAEAARSEIDDAFANHRILLGRGNPEASIQLLVDLSKALAENSPQFGPRGRRWAESLMLKLVDLTEQIPPAPAAIILEHSSQLLAEIPPNGPRQQSLITNVSPQSETQDVVTLGPPSVDLQTLAVPTEQTLARAQPPASQPTTQSLARPVTPIAPQEPTDPEPAQVDTKVTTLPWVSSGKSSLSVEVDEPSPPRHRSGLVDVPSPGQTQRRVAQLRTLSTRVLLEKLPHAEQFLAGPIRYVLERRGISEAEIEMTSSVFAGDVAQRLALVEQTAKLPATSARRLLRLMLEDSHADVRLRALTTLATMNDPQLASLAKEITIRDKDPRVADLAAELMRK